MILFIKRILLFLIISLTLSSCSNIVLRLYGIKTIKPVSETTILKYGKKYNIPIKDSFEIDTSYFFYLLSLDNQKYGPQIKNHYQPLQALYYDTKGNLQSFHVNCYAGGFPNLKWDGNGIFDNFIPKQQAPLDSIVPLFMQVKYLVPVSSTENISSEEYDFVIVVHWNRFMGRQSKRLIKIVQENAKLSSNRNIRIIYANNDNMQFLAEKNGSR